MEENFQIDQHNIKEVLFFGKDCTMNTLKNAHINEYVDVYQCGSCDMDNICKSCLMTCHDSNDPEPKTKLLREVFFCLCHSHSHECNDRNGEEIEEKHEIYSEYFKIPFLRHAERDLCFLCLTKNALEIKEHKWENLKVETNIQCKEDSDDSYSISYLFYAFDYDIKRLSTLSYYDIANYNTHFLRFNNGLIMQDYCTPVYQAHEKLMNFFKDSGLEAIKALEIISLFYNDRMDGFKKIKDNFPLAPSIRKDKTMLKIFNFDFVLKLFELPINKQDYLYSFKCYSLKFFIDMFIKQNIEHKIKKILTCAYVNSSPLHRFLFRDNLGFFFQTLGITKEDFTSLLDNVFVTLQRSFEQKDPDPRIEVIFTQYYRLLKYMFSYNIEEFSLIEKYIFQLISLKESCHLLPHHLPKLIKVLFYAVNDFKFIECYKKNERVEKFIFENSPLNIKLVKLLFSINSKQEEINFPVELYDLLMVKHDEYIESLDSLFNCRKNYIMDEMIKIKENDVKFLPPIKSKSQAKTTSDITSINLKEEEEEQLFEEIDFNSYINDQVLFTTYDEKEYFLSNKFKEDFEKMMESFTIDTTLLEELNTIRVGYLHTLRDHISKSLNLCSNVKKSLKQMWFFKNGIFGMLLETNDIVHRNSLRFKTDDPLWAEYPALKSNKEEIQDLMTEIQEEIEFLIFKLAEDNSFLSSLLFSEKALRLHLGPYNINKKKINQFRTKLLNNLTKEDYKIDYKPFIDHSRKEYYDISLDSEEDFTCKLTKDLNNGTLLEMYLGMLKTSSASSLDEVNHLVFTEIVKNSCLIEDVYFRFLRTLNNLRRPKCIESSENILRRQASTIMKDDPEKVLLYLVTNLNRVLNNLSSCYSYLIVQKLPFLYESLSKIIPHSTLKPEDKVHFVKLYSKFYLKFPYKIYDLTTSQEVKMKVYANEKNEEDSDENQVESKLDRENYPYFKKYFDQATDNLKPDPSYPINEIYSSNFYDDKEDLILDMIENFPSYFSKYKNESFHKNPRFSLKYFLNAILNPLCSVLYKIVYFKGPNFENKIKYRIYKAVCLLYKSYKKIIENLVATGYIKEEYYKLYRTFFKIDKDDKDMNIYFLEIISELDKTIKEFESDTVDFLDAETMLQRFSFAIGKIRFRLKKNKHYKDNLDWNKMCDLFKTVSKFQYRYQNRKSEFENTAVVKLIVDQSCFEVNDQIDLIKKNLAFEVLNLYSKTGDQKKDQKETNAVIKKETHEIAFVEVKESEKVHEKKETIPETDTLNESNTNVIIEPLSLQPEVLVIENKQSAQQCQTSSPSLNTDNIEIENETVLELYENPRKSYYLKLLNRIIENDPTYYQNCYFELCCLNKDNAIGNSRFKFVPRIANLSQFIFTEFANIRPDQSNFFIKTYKQELKFLSLLTKKCNDFFIKYFAEYVCELRRYKTNTKSSNNEHQNKGEVTDNKDFKFCNFLLDILSNVIDHISHYDKVHKYLNMISIEERIVGYKEEFFPSIYRKLFYLNKQFVQSLKIIKDSYNLNNLQETVEKNILENLSKFMKEKNNKLTDFILNFLDLVCMYIFDEKPRDYVEINPNLILKLFIILYEFIFEKYVKQGQKNQILTSEMAYNNRELLDKLTKNEEIYKDSYFKIFSGIFLYFINLCHYENKYMRLYSTINKYSNETVKELSYKQKTLSEILNFFTQIIRMTEILVKYDEVSFKFNDDYYKWFIRGDNSSINKKDLKDKSQSKPVPKMVYFQVCSDGVFIIPGDEHEFVNNLALINRPNAKLTYFLEYYDYIKTLIQVRKTLTNSQSNLMSFLFKMDYSRIEYISIIMIMITNMLSVFSMVHSGINGFVSPLSNWVFSSALIHLIFLFFCLANLAYVEFSKFYQLNNIKKEPIIFSTYVKTYVTKSFYTLLWNFSIGLVAILNPSLNFLYALQLFSIFAQFETMRTVLVAIHLKYKEFLSTGVLVLILILFYSFISVFYFQAQYDNPDLNENSCSTLLHCFLFFIYNGIRTGAGFGFPIKSAEESGFWSEFFFDWLFYFSIILILLNIVNGVIVDTFQSLRVENENLKDRKENFCFICSFNRTKYEAKGVDFNEHKQREHNILDYYQFFYKIDNMKEENLNYVESYVFKKKNLYSADFLPNKTSYRFVKSEDN